MRVLEPKRSHYRKISGTHKTCPFCSEKIIKDQGIKKLDTEYWRVLACKYPYLDGNLMIIPKRHAERTEDLHADEWADLHTALKKSQRALSKLFKTTSFNIGVNIGPASGSSIKHLHWMLLPRPKNINYAAFDTMNGIYVISMDYKTLIRKLKKILK